MGRVKIKDKVSLLQWDYAEYEYIATNPYESRETRHKAVVKLIRIERKINKLEKRLDKNY